MAGTITVDTIQSDSSYNSVVTIPSKVNFTGGMQVGGQDTTFGGMRNRIINGAMTIDQRFSGASNTATEWTYSLDRWVNYSSATSKFTFQQMNGVDSSASNYEANSVPPGFRNSVKLTSTSAHTVTSAQRHLFSQIIEGYNLADLAWGTSSAKSVTLSFWVKSSLTGTFGVSICDTPQSISFPYTYTINQVNTWEYKTITIPGPTTGTWDKANGRGLWLFFDLGTGTSFQGTPSGSWQGSSIYTSSGCVNLIGTNGATLYLTGIQLEKGSSATDFEFRHHQQELSLCQRYCVLYASGGETIGTGLNWTGGNYWCATRMPVTMRSTPTMSCTTGTNYYSFYSASSTAAASSLLDAAYTGGACLGNLLYRDGLSGLTSGYANTLKGSDDNMRIFYTAEL